MRHSLLNFFRIISKEKFDKKYKEERKKMEKKTKIRNN